MANETKYFKTPFAESGTRTEVPNASVGGAVGFDTGFGPDYELPQGSAGRKRIERDKYNGLHHSITKNLKQWQEGLYPTWIEDAGAGAAFSYPLGMIVNHAGQDWISNEDANQEKPGDGVKWKVYSPVTSLQQLSGLTESSDLDQAYPRNFTSVGLMVSYTNHALGLRYSTGGTIWEVVNTYGVPLGGGLFAKPIDDIFASDYMTLEHYTDAESVVPSIDSTSVLQSATDDASLCKCNVILSTVFLLKGDGGTNNGRLVDGVGLKSNVSYYAIRRGEVRLDLSCVVGFGYRPHTPVTSLAQAPKDINFYGIKFSRPNSTWDVALENTAIIYIAAINGMKIKGCDFTGWVGDAILLGINDDATLSAILETYIKNVAISGCKFDGVNNGNRQAISILEGVDIHLHHNEYLNCTRSALPNPMPGAIDIEPILASAKVANITVEHETFDGVGGVTGVVSLALSFPLDMPAHNIHVRHNTFRNIKNKADFYAIGPTSVNHTSLPANAPYDVSFTENSQEAVPSGEQNRRWYVGGIKKLEIARNSVTEGNDAALIGYDDGVNKWPLIDLTLRDNKVNNWIVDGAAPASPITFFGGIIGGDIGGNTYTDCGNKVGSPVDMNVLAFRGNGSLSKNVTIDKETFINNGSFFISSIPIYAPVLTNPSTFKVTGSTFFGLNESAYNSTNSIYARAVSDFYEGFITAPSTSTPAVGGIENLNGVTGDTWTNFSGGQNGQSLFIVGSSSGCVIQHNANIVLKLGVNFNVTAGKTISLKNLNGVWYEI